MKWSQIIQDERYTNASTEEKSRIKESWYEKTVKSDPRYKPELDTTIRSSIFGNEQIPQENKQDSAEESSSENTLTKGIIQGIKNLAVDTAPVVGSALAASKAAEQIYGRPQGAIRSLIAGESPAKGFMEPEKAPVPSESVMRALPSYGIDPRKEPEKAFWISTIVGTAADVGIFELINKSGKAFGEVLNSAPVQSKLSELSFHIKKRLGIPQDTSIELFDYNKAIEEGRITLANAAKSSSRAFDEFNIKRGMGSAKKGVVPNDTQNIKGVQSSVKVGQEPGRVPQQSVGSEEARAGGILQGQGQVETKSLFPARYEPYVTEVRGDVEKGQLLKKGRTETGEWYGGGSTFPEWFQNKGWTKKQVINVIDKASQGKDLTQKQQTIYNAVLNAAAEKRIEAADYLMSLSKEERRDVLLTVRNMNDKVFTEAQDEKTDVTGKEYDPTMGGRPLSETSAANIESQIPEPIKQSFQQADSIAELKTQIDNLEKLLDDVEVEDNTSVDPINPEDYIYEPKQEYIPGMPEAQMPNEPLKSTKAQKEDVLSEMKPKLDVQKDLFVSEPKQSYTPNANAFKSKLIESIQNSQNNAWTPSALKGFLNKQGISPEEIEHTDLENFLDGKEKVSKEDLLDYLKKNQITLDVVVKGGFDSLLKQAKEKWKDSRSELKTEQAKLEYILKGVGYTGIAAKNVISGFLSNDQRVVMASEKYLHDNLPGYDYSKLKNISIQFINAAREYQEILRKHDTIYSRYLIPGGENYQEVLITIPKQKLPTPARVSYSIEGKKVKKDFSDYNEAKKFFEDKTNFPSGAKSIILQPTSSPRYKEQFSSSHFEEKNIVVHLRADDRVDIDGKKTFFIEEIQSDWAQQGRKIGYITGKRHAFLKSLQEKYPSLPTDTDLWSLETLDDAGVTEEEKNTWWNLDKPGTVPNMPYKKSWHELAIKQALRMAAEGGYDQLAWTPGDVQADRYDLSKQVDEIQLQGDFDQSIEIMGGRKGELELRHLASANKNNLENYIGKELAHKALNEGKTHFRGLDLKIGGEGMRGFYDNIIPKAAEKIAKKIDTEAQIGKTNIQVGEDMVEVWSIPITEKMVVKILQEGQYIREPQSAFKSESEAAYDGKEASYNNRASEEMRNIRPASPVRNTTRSSVAEQFKQKGYVDHVGQEVKSTQDAAELAAIFRNPYVENFQIIYVKDGVVAAHNVLSSGNASYVKILPSAKTLQSITSAAMRLNANEVYIAHNHPNGIPNPSDGDIEFTKRASQFLKERGIALKGHVVTNGGKYAVIDDSGVREESFKEAKQQFPKQGYIFDTVRSPFDVYAATNDVVRMNPDKIHVLYLNSANQTVAHSIYKTDANLAETVKQHKRANVADYYIVIVPNKAVVPASLPEGVRDVIALTPERYNPYQSIPLKSINIENDERPLARIQESLEPYENDAETISQKPLQGIEAPELVALAQELSGKRPTLKKFQSSQGKFYSATGQIKLDPSIFKDPRQAAETLAHEIGHLADWLPDYNLNRGNEIARMVTMVSRFMKSTFSPATGGPADLNKIRKAAFSAFKAQTGIKDIAEHKEEWRDFYQVYRKAVLENGGFIDNSDLRNELKDLTQIWKPFDEIASPAWYSTYRYSAKELYADFMSVLLNDPKMAEKVAPKSYRLFFDFLDKKPDVKSNYLKLQAILSGDRSALYDMRRRDIVAMFEHGEDEVRAIKERGIMARKSLSDRLKQAFIDKHHFILKGRTEVAKKETIRPEDDPKYWLDEMNYIGSVVKAHLHKLEPAYEQMMKEGIDNEVGIMLFLERIAAGDREDLANPLGHNPKTAMEFLSEFSRKDPEKFQKASAIADSVRAWFSDINAIMAEDILSDSQKENISKSGKYAPYRVVAHMKDFVSAGIIPQTGTLSDISNPFTAAVLKGISMIRAVERNRVKKSVGNFILAHPEIYGQVEPAKITSYPGVFKVKTHKYENMKPVVWRENGKWTGIYVDKDIASSFEYDTTGTLAIAGDLINKMLMNNFFRKMYITFNPGFQAFNLMRDFRRYWINTPSLSFVDALKSYKEAYPHAVNKVKGHYDDLINEMEKAKAIGVTYNQFLDGETTEDKEIQSVMNKFDLGRMSSQNKSAIKKMLIAVQDFGDVIETIPKVAAYQRTSQIPEHQRAYAVRNFAGTPNYKRGGTLKPIYNNVLMFSNIIKEAYRSMLESGFESRKTSGSAQSRGAWAWKMSVLNIVPKIIMYIAGTGILGAALKEVMDSASEYDKTNYVIVPLPGKINGKNIYLRIVQDEDGRFFSAILWKLLHVKEAGLGNSLEQIFSFTGAQIPFAGGLAPLLSIAKVWKDFAEGQNPLDQYRGRNILTEDEYKAGGFDAIIPMLKWTANQSGQIKLNIHDSFKDQTLIEKAISIAPVVNRFIRVTDYGKTETLYQELDKLNSETSRESLKMRRLEKDVLSGDKTMWEAKREVPYDKRKMFQKRINQLEFSSEDPVAKVIKSANSNEKKEEILRKAIENGYITDPHGFIKKLYRARIISNEEALKMMGKFKKSA